jgi:cytochrome c oxidase subunit 3
MADYARGHDYHLVDPSPWPIMGAIGAFVLALGLLYFLQGGSILWLIPGAAVLAYTMVGWWRDVIREAEYEGHHTAVVQIGLRYGMALFIASEVMFFVVWFWGYFNAALFPGDAVGGVWPPRGIKTFEPFGLPFLNTLILLTSGTTVTWAHHSLLHGRRKGLVQGLILTVLLGIAFTAIQAYEFSHAAFGFTEGIYASTFFMATGFHGAHVIIGTIFLSVCLFRAMAGHFTAQQHFGLEAAAWYWHFVDVVWLFLFSCIYWWGAGTAGV